MDFTGKIKLQTDVYQQMTLGEVDVAHTLQHSQTSPPIVCNIVEAHCICLYSPPIVCRHCTLRLPRRITQHR